MTQGSPAWWLASATIITLDLKASRRQRQLCFLVILLSLFLWGGLLLYTRMPWMMLPASITVLAAIHEWRTTRKVDPSHIEIDVHRGLIRFDDQVEAFHLVDTLCLPILVALRCRGRSVKRFWSPARTVLIWRDSIEATQHRELRRWLRQREAQGAAGTTGSS